MLQGNGNHRQEIGLSLIELITVIAIIALLTSIAIPAYNDYIENAKKGECFNEVAAIRLAEEEVLLNTGSYFTGDDVDALETNSGTVYRASARAKSESERNCTYEVSACQDDEGKDQALTGCYKVTATGTNALSGTIVSLEGP